MTRRGTKALAAGTLATLLVAVVPLTPAFAVPSAPASRYASIVIEAETGKVLYERNADLPRFPASLTKMMTLYLTFEALASKKLALTDQVPVSEHAATRDPSRIDLSPGSRLKVEDAIRAMTTKSANDAACAMAEALGKGSEAKFAAMMTAKAKALGLTHTTFKNGSGLPEDGHVTTARDLALLGQALVRDYPQYYHYFSADDFQYRGARFPNQNRFLRTYYGADGIKTGFVNASGHNLAASAVRGGKRLIAVVLGGDTQAWTREHATRLLDVAYAKIDPSLVMVASNATTEPESATPATPEAATASATPVAETGSTAAGAVKVASTGGLPLPNATANLAAYASTVSPAPGPVGSVSAPAGSAAPAPARSGGTAPANVAAAPAAAAPAVKPATAAPAGPNPAATAAPAAPSVPAPSAARPSAPSQATASPAAAPTEDETARRAAQAGTARTSAAKPAGPAPSAASPSRPAVTPVTKPQPEAAPAPADAAASPGRPARPESGDWSVQVGLYRDATIARRRGEEARRQMPVALRGADLVVSRASDGVHVVSRIARLSEQDAREACSALQRGQVPCVVVPPGRPLVVATN